MKRIISLVLVLVLALGLMACASGCKKGNNTKLLEGQVIRIASWGGDQKPAAGTEVGDLLLEAVAASEEKYGCTVEYTMISDIFTQLVTAATTGQVIGEVILNRVHKAVELQMKGDYYWSVEELGGDVNDEIFNDDCTKYSTYNGKTYCWFYNPTRPNYMMAVNKSIIERNGGTIPYDLVEDRKWNWEEWKKLMILGTDPNQGIYGGGRDQASAQVFLHTNDTGVYGVDTNGVHIANTSDSKLVESLEFLLNITTKDKVYETNLGASWDHVYKLFQDGKYVTAPCYLALFKQFQKDMSDDFGIMPMPIGPSATEYKKLDTECQGYCIQKAVDLDYAKALFQFMNETFAYPLDPVEGMKGAFESYAPDKESLENLMLVQSLPLTVVDEFTAPDNRSYSGASIDFAGMMSGTVPIRSHLESQTPSIQAAIDQYWGQKPQTAE